MASINRLSAVTKVRSYTMAVAVPGFSKDSFHMFSELHPNLLQELFYLSVLSGFLEGKRRLSDNMTNSGKRGVSSLANTGETYVFKKEEPFSIFLLAVRICPFVARCDKFAGFCLGC